MRETLEPAKGALLQAESAFPQCSCPLALVTVSLARTGIESFLLYCWPTVSDSKIFPPCRCRGRVWWWYISGAGDRQSFQKFCEEAYDDFKTAVEVGKAGDQHYADASSRLIEVEQYMRDGGLIPGRNPKPIPRCLP